MCVILRVGRASCISALYFGVELWAFDDLHFSLCAPDHRPQHVASICRLRPPVCGGSICCLRPPACGGSMPPSTTCAWRVYMPPSTTFCLAGLCRFRPPACEAGICHLRPPPAAVPRSPARACYHAQIHAGPFKTLRRRRRATSHRCCNVSASAPQSQTDLSDSYAATDRPGPTLLGRTAVRPGYLFRSSRQSNSVRP